MKNYSKGPRKSKQKSTIKKKEEIILLTSTDLKTSKKTHQNTHS
jgi:hypothetical protein